MNLQGAEVEILIYPFLLLLLLPHLRRISKVCQTALALHIIASRLLLLLLLGSSHSLSYYLASLSKHLRMVWKIPVADLDLVDWVVIISTLGQILTHLGQLRERLIVKAIVHATQTKVGAFNSSCSLTDNHSSSVASVLRSNSSLEPQLAQIAKIGKVLDVKSLLVCRECFFDVDVDIVDIIKVIRPLLCYSFSWLLLVVPLTSVAFLA